MLTKSNKKGIPTWNNERLHNLSGSGDARALENCELGTSLGKSGGSINDPWGGWSVSSASLFSLLAVISVLHLVVLSSGLNRALITLSRALPSLCLRVEFLSSLLKQSATPSPYNPHAARSVPLTGSPVRPRRVHTALACFHLMFVAATAAGKCVAGRNEWRKRWSATSFSGGSRGAMEAPYFTQRGHFFVHNSCSLHLGQNSKTHYHFYFFFVHSQNSFTQEVLG